MNILDKIRNEGLKENVADFNIGDNVKVFVKIVEGNTERIQVFAGTVIARRGSGIEATFTVRRVVSGTAVVSGGAVSVVSATGASVAGVGSGTGSGVWVTITGCSLVCTGGSVSGSVSACVWTGAAVVSVGSGTSVTAGSVTCGSSGGGPQGPQGS